MPKTHRHSMQGRVLLIDLTTEDQGDGRVYVASLAADPRVYFSSADPDDALGRLVSYMESRKPRVTHRPHVA